MRGLRYVLACCLAFICSVAWCEEIRPSFEPVMPGKSLEFPRDLGAHPGFKTEWWYATGWLETSTHKPIGFQVTFFRSATGYAKDNPSRFAPRQLIVAHLALSDASLKTLLHEQKVEREAFDIAYAEQGNTDLKIDGWTMLRKKDGNYQIDADANNLGLHLEFIPTQPNMLQGDQGYSRKGPQSSQASYYYSEPQLRVSGRIREQGKDEVVTGKAWLDHEWSSQVLDADAVGWDWVGANLDDGSALMAFQVRGRDSKTLWSHAALRDSSGKTQQFDKDAIEFKPLRTWTSPKTSANYPISMRLRVGDHTFTLTPLQDDQELDGRTSTGSSYWEGASKLQQEHGPSGQGYLELTGYDKPLKL